MGRRTDDLCPVGVRYHLVSPAYSRRQVSPRSVQVLGIRRYGTVMREVLRFLSSSAIFRESEAQVSTPSHPVFGIAGIAGITEYRPERTSLSPI